MSSADESDEAGESADGQAASPGVREALALGGAAVPAQRLRNNKRNVKFE